MPQDFLQQSIKQSTSRNQQSLPSSYSLNPQYFTNRLVRIKQKVDELIKQNIPSFGQQKQPVLNEGKIEFVNDEKRSSYQTAQTHHTSYGRMTREHIPVQKIVGETKIKIKSVYNEVHLLESVAMRDENVVETNTIELRSFLKDLRKQCKRLTRIIPEQILFQLENQKNQIVKRSQIKLKQVDTIKSVDTQNKENGNEELNMAKKTIQEQLKKRKVFNQNQRYYSDAKQEDQPNCLMKCQII